MLPKEKADELIEKFKTLIYESDFHIPKFISGIDMLDTDEYEKVLEEHTTELAVECAKSSVNEMIEENHKMDDYSENVTKILVKQLDFLNSVKDELNKI